MVKFVSEVNFVPSNRMRTLYLLRILSERTDAAHPMTLQALSEALGEYGINSERKSLYRDIDALCEAGYEVIRTRSDCVAYYMEPYPFSPQEYDMLEDAVASAEFIPRRRSAELVRKMRSLRPGAEDRRPSVFVPLRVKAEHAVCDKFAAVRQAMDVHCRVVFSYGETPRREKTFELTPFGFVRTSQGLCLVAGSAHLEEALGLYPVRNIRALRVSVLPAEDIRAVTGNIDFNLEKFLDGLAETDKK